MKSVLSSRTIVLLCVGVISTWFLQCANSPGIEIAESIEELQQRVFADSNDPIAYYNLSLGYISKKKYESAQAALDQALTIDPGFAEAHFAKYCVSYLQNRDKYDRQSDDKRMRDTSILVKTIDGHLTKAQLNNPFFDWRIATILLKSRPSSNDPEVQAFIDAYYEYIVSGFRMFTLGQYAESVDKLSQTLEIIPNYTQAYMVRGYANAQLGRYDSAIVDFERVIEKLDDYNKNRLLPVYINTAEIKYVEACAYVLKKDYQKAEQIFKAVLLEDFSFYMAHIQMSRMFMKLGMHKQALSEAEAAVMIRPEDPLLHYDKAIVLTALKDYEAALIEYDEVIKLNPRNCKAYYNAAILLDRIGKHDEAKPYYQKFIDMSSIRNVEFLAHARAQLRY